MLRRSWARNPGSSSSPAQRSGTSRPSERKVTSAGNETETNAHSSGTSTVDVQNGADPIRSVVGYGSAYARMSSSNDSSGSDSGREGPASHPAKHQMDCDAVVVHCRRAVGAVDERRMLARHESHEVERVVLQADERAREVEVELQLRYLEDVVELCQEAAHDRRLQCRDRVTVHGNATSISVRPRSPPTRSGGWTYGMGMRRAPSASMIRRRSSGAIESSPGSTFAGSWISPNTAASWFPAAPASARRTSTDVATRLWPTRAFRRLRSTAMYESSPQLLAG